MTLLVCLLQPRGADPRGGDRDLAELHPRAVRAGPAAGMDQPPGLPLEDTGRAHTSPITPRPLPLTPRPSHLTNRLDFLEDTGRAAGSHFTHTCTN